MVFSRPKSLLGLTCIFVGMGLTWPRIGHCQQARPSALPTLTKVEQIRELSPDEAKRGYPVQVQAVVTFIDTDVGDFIAQDSTAGIYVNENHLNLNFQPGDLLEIDGVTEDPDFAPQIAQARYRKLGRAPLPRPLPVHMDDMLSTREDSQWVQIEGIVQDIEPAGSHWRLELASEGRRMGVEIMDPAGVDKSRLLDAKVRVNGACATIFNPNNQLVAVLVLTPSAREIAILEPPLADPFSAPLRSISSLRAFTTRNTSAHRVRVQGTVTLRRPRGVFIQDGRQGLYLPGSPSMALQVGDRVDVVGFADVGECTPVLLHALYQRIGSAPLPAPLVVTAQKATASELDTVRVRIDGILREERTTEVDKTLVLQDGEVVFEARIAANKAHGFRPPPAGSRLRLTGVCSVTVDRNRAPEAFNILLDSPEGISVLARPSWWNARNTWAVLGSLLGMILAVMAWVVVLRRRVRSQTEIIRRRLESEVALERRHQYVGRAINDTIWDWDLATQAISWSAGLITNFRYQAHEVQTAIAWRSERLHPEDREASERSLAAVIAGGGETWSGEYRFRCGDGNYAYVLDRVYVMHDDSGKAVRIIGAMMDMTARKQVEEDMQRAMEAAEAANRAKSEFVANMSHEIRTPMNGILGMTELALATDLTSEQSEYLGMVKSCADSLLRIINDILDFSKIEAGKLDIENIEFNLRATIEATLKTIAPAAHMKGLKLNCQIEPAVPEVLLGDPMRLRQVLLNLLGNSLKFTERGEISLRVGRESQEGGAVNLRFSVEDTGIGISTDKQSRIFEPFTQADGSTTRRFGGTGLGLTISRQLVQMMGGKIWMQSVPGRGSTFHFTTRLGVVASEGRGLAGEAETIPQARTAGPAAPESALAVRPAKSEPRPLRILLAEDNLVNQLVVMRLLEKHGHQVAAAGNGRAVLGLLRESAFDAVLLDIQMPEMDGFETAAAIRQEEESTGKHLPIIAMTAHSMQGDRERCLSAGMDGYIAKPIRPKDLAEALADIAPNPPAEDISGNPERPQPLPPAPAAPPAILVDSHILPGEMGASSPQPHPLE